MKNVHYSPLAEVTAVPLEPHPTPIAPGTPIQVLTRSDPAWLLRLDVIGCDQGRMTVSLDQWSFCEDKLISVRPK